MNFTDLENILKLVKMIEIVILKTGHDVIFVRMKEEHMKINNLTKNIINR